MSTPTPTPSRRRGAHFSAPDDASQPSGSSQPAADQAAPRATQAAQGVRQPDSARGSEPLGTATAPRPVMGGRTSSASARVASRGVGVVGRTPRGPRRDQRRRVPVVLVVVILVAVVAAVAALVLLSTGSEEESEDETTTLLADGTQVTITVADGSGASTIAYQLYDAGLIDDVSAFLTQVRRLDAETSLQSGTYTFTAGSSYSELITQLCEGSSSVDYTITIPEGYTLASIAALVESELGISADEFLAQATVANYVSDYSFLEGLDQTTLEGYLFPKTYGFMADELSADTVIRAMLDQFETEVASLDLDAYAEALSSRYGIEVTAADIVTMASIVEKEALTDDQRGLIASVFFNRLSIGMYLQSDATLTYSLGYAASSEELNSIDDPYNTYLYGGLTPTPICSPGLASIEAVCDPDDTSYYYFYITSEYEAFSETYDEHLTAIANDPS